MWLRGGTTLQTDARVSIDSLGRLIFSPVFSTDAASYTCTATNSVGTASAVTNVMVLGRYKDCILNQIKIIYFMILNSQTIQLFQ